MPFPLVGFLFFNQQFDIRQKYMYILMYVLTDTGLVLNYQLRRQNYHSLSSTI